MDTRKVAELKLWDKNPRSINEKDFARLKKQIQELGQYKPLIITPDNEVIGGNMRLRAYQELKIDEVWVSVVDVKTDEMKLKYALSDNDRAGFYDSDLLADLTGEYPDFEWGEFAVDLKQPTTIDELLPKEVDEDEVPEVDEEETTSKYGEVYQLGRHRLMCGDATKIEDVEKLMNGKKADMVFTDPPYGVKYEQGKFTGTKVKKVFDAIANDDKQGVELYNFIYDVMVNVNAVSNNASVYVCSPSMTESLAILYACMEAGFHMQSQIIWYKNQFILGRGDYHWQHEIIWYGYKDNPHYWCGARDKGTVWSVHKDAHADYNHPTQKPVELAGKAIQNSSKQDDIVLDLFGGSGSTLIAAEQTNRTCYMMELDPKYCDVIRKRYENFTKDSRKTD